MVSDVWEVSLPLRVEFYSASPINFTTQLVLDGQVVAEAVNKYNLQDGNRGTGGTY